MILDVNRELPVSGHRIDMLGGRNVMDFRHDLALDCILVFPILGGSLSRLDFDRGLGRVGADLQDCCSTKNAGRLTPRQEQWVQTTGRLGFGAAESEVVHGASV